MVSGFAKVAIFLSFDFHFEGGTYLGIKSLKVVFPSPSPNSKPPKGTVFSSIKSPCSST